MTQRSKKWKVWSQHWFGYKPRVFGTYLTEDEAVEACRNLNASPSGQWLTYFVEAPR